MIRLLDTYTGQFEEKDPKRTKYAIFSHTWDHKQGEQKYAELRKIQQRYPTLPRPMEQWREAQQVPGSIWDDPKLSHKIRKACELARNEGYHHIWIDFCCIDKTNSTELARAIRSMYAWYAGAGICYVHLADVFFTKSLEDSRKATPPDFRKARWFTRAWTLQELIAPRQVHFVSKGWKLLGTKDSLLQRVVDITSIHRDALLHRKPLNEFSVAQRLSWAVGRKATQPQDRTYSLVGIFNIDIPAGHDNPELAFQQLQVAIMKSIPDQSLFAWKRIYFEPWIEDNSNQVRYYRYRKLVYKASSLIKPSLLSPSPDRFSKLASGIRPIPREDVLRQLGNLLPSEVFPTLTFSKPTERGLSAKVPLLPLSLFLPSSAILHADDAGQPKSEKWYLLILACKHERCRKSFLGRVCYIHPTASASGSVDHLYCGFVEVLKKKSDLRPTAVDLFPLPVKTIKGLSSHIRVKEVYMPL